MGWMIFKNHPPSQNHMDDGSKWTANYWDDARMTTLLVYFHLGWSLDDGRGNCETCKEINISLCNNAMCVSIFCFLRNRAHHPCCRPNHPPSLDDDPQSSHHPPITTKPGCIRWKWGAEVVVMGCCSMDMIIPTCCEHDMQKRQKINCRPTWA